MGLATQNDKCMFFVGGNKAKSLNPTGQTFAGGCTKAWWDAEVASTDKETAMSKLMGADGEPIDSAAVTHSDYTGYTKLTSAGNFTNSEAGMLLYHPNSAYPFSGGGGFYKILAVDPGGDWVIIDKTFGTLDWTNDGDTVYVGGAWSDPRAVTQYFVLANYYTQEVWINRDFTISTEWSWDYWSGYQLRNTFMVVRGFHRTPGDITDTDGAYHQTALSCKNDGVDNDKFVGVNLNSLADVAIDVEDCHNIVFQGFRVYGQNASYKIFKADATTDAFGNLDISGNVFDISAQAFLMSYGSNILFLANYIYASTPVGPNAPGVVTVYEGGHSVIYGNIFDFDDQYTIAVQNPEDGTVVFNNYIDGEYAGIQGGVNGSYVAINNIIKGSAFGGIMASTYNAISLNNIIMPKAHFLPAFDVSSSGGSIISKNDCAFSEDGQQLDNVMYNGYSDGQLSPFENLLEVDPLLDSDNEPLEEQVRLGGMPNVLGDPTSLGAIQTMNTTVINTAVQAAMTSQGYTAGRAPKLDNLDQSISSVDALVNAVIAKTDNLPADPCGVSDLANIDTSDCKLASDGLDSVVVAEPAGSPSGWSFAQCLRWLIMRFMNKHTSDNFSGIAVHKGDGTVSTEQAVTEVSGVKSVGKVQ